MFSSLALAFAFRFPRMAKFVGQYWKLALALALAFGAWWWFTSWRDNLIDTADAAGFARAEQQYTEAVDDANERERLTQGRLDQMVIAFGALGEQREQAINLTVKPMTESITNEVETDPRYRECIVSSGVLDDLNAGRAAVNAGVAASNPR